MIGAVLKRLIITLFLLFTSTLYATENMKYGKMVLLYIEMSNCPWCERMDRELFEDSFNLSEMKKMYIVQRLKKESKALPSYIRPKYYPTTYILSSDGSKIVDELPGYMKAEDFLDYIETLYDIEVASH